MFVFKILILSAAYLACTAQNYQTTTPVPILKQINKQNDDGSYSFGYEAADGSFKIETKYPNGDVAGKYGYVDEGGKLREISYGASSQRGFEPQGTGIMVPPPTLHDPSSTNALTDGQEDDGQYREDPKIYEDPKYNRGQKSSAPLRQYHKAAQQTQQQQSFQTEFTSPSYNQQPSLFTRQEYQPQQNYQRQQAYQPQPQPAYQQQSVFNQSPQQFPQQDFRPQSQVYHQQPQFSYQSYTPSYNQPNYQQNYQSFPQNFNPFVGHPAQNFDPNTGSYTINFTG